MQFPHLKVISSPVGVEAVAAIRISSLLHSSLLVDTFYGEAEGGKYPIAAKVDPRQLHHAREALLSAISDWVDTILELRLSVVPDLTRRTQSLINFHCLIRCPGEKADTARELLATRYLTLLPLLSAHVPEAVCEPVTDAGELDWALGWMKPKHAVSLQRRREEISLAKPLEQRKDIGFLSAGDGCREEKEAATPTVFHLAPWVPELDDWGRLLDTLTCQIDPQLIILRLRPLSSTAREREALREALRQCEDYLLLQNDRDATASGSLVHALRNQYVSRMVALQGPCFAVGVYLLAEGPLDSAYPRVLGAALTHLPQGNDPAHFFKGGYTLRDVPASAALRADFFADDAAFSLGEAACAFRLPSPPNRDIPGLKVKRFRTALAQLPAEREGRGATIRLFVNEHMGVSQPVEIDVEERMRHIFILGQTGTGKSSLMESMIVQDIHAGRGVAVIDPHGDMVENVLRRIPKERGEEVILFDFLDWERPIGFNLIAWRTIMERDLIIDELYRVLDHVYDMRSTGGPMFENQFRNVLRMLMGSQPRKGFVPTILDFHRAYVDRDFRHWLRDTCDDPLAHNFLREAERAGGEASWDNMSQYITSKFTRFVADSNLRRIVGQQKSSLDFDDILDSGKILLVKLGKGRFGSQVSALLANMMVLRFKLAAMQRGERPMERRRDFFLYVDEAHNLPRENFAEMLAEVRKYRMGLVLSTQYCSQLGNLQGADGNDLLSAVFGNVGTFLTFRAGAHDAEELSRGLRPYFEALDVMALPNFHGYARMNLGPEITPPFSFRTELTTEVADEQSAHFIREYSRLSYGKPASLVDREITHKALANEFGVDTATAEAVPEAFKPSVTNLALLELHLEHVGLPENTFNLLVAGEITTLRQLLAHDMLYLHVVVKLNSDDFRELDKILAEHGCFLNELPTEWDGRAAPDEDANQGLFSFDG
ncbi:MAG: DUF87 domain-containing protein [Deltaproteobacteria bacterium]|nr:MAG: DUF87 domain-containing protein [Deltaproteobacteria bacterium]